MSAPIPFPRYRRSVCRLDFVLCVRGYFSSTGCGMAGHCVQAERLTISQRGRKHEASACKGAQMHEASNVVQADERTDATIVSSTLVKSILLAGVNAGATFPGERIRVCTRGPVR